MLNDESVRDDHGAVPATALVVIPCGAAKRSHPSPAGELYIGSYHRACRRAADRLGGRLLILSARHGLLLPDRVIEPYDLAMGRPGSVTVEVLREQAQELDVADAGPVFVLAGWRYAAAAAGVWPLAARPLLGLGIGGQLHRLAEIARHGHAALTDADGAR